MTAADLVEALPSAPDLPTQTALGSRARPAPKVQRPDALKEEADRLLRSDVQRSLDLARTLQEMGEAEQNGRTRALGLLAEANAYTLGGLGQYAQAVKLYDRAAETYHDQGSEAEAAGAAVGKVFALAMLGQYEEALQVGEAARRTLERSQSWRPLMNLSMNLAVVHGRRREDAFALEEFDRTLTLAERLGDAGRQMTPLIQQDRAIVLRNLGRFNASMEANRRALEQLEASAQPAEVGHVQQNMAATYILLGRFNEALALLDQARDTFLVHQRPVDAIEVDLATSFCLLQLRRFDDVLETCQRVQQLCQEIGRQREVADATLNEAQALAGLHRYDEAMAALERARQLFQSEGNAVAIVKTDLERAALLHLREQYQEALDLAAGCAEAFQRRNLPVPMAQAWLAAAKAAAALGQYETAETLARQALTVGLTKELAELTFGAYSLQATVAEARGQHEAALQHYEQAIRSLEQLRGRMMVEFRAGFLEDKLSPYQGAVSLCLALDRPALGLDYAERAKSRALVDMLAFKLNLGVAARRPEDEPLVAELQELQSRRDSLFRRWRSEMEPGHSQGVNNGQQAALNRDALALEGEITRLWHKLLVRNADYARDAALWQVRTEPVQPLLDPQTAVLEYFVAGDELVAFVVSRDNVSATPLGISERTVHRTLRRLLLNFSAVPAGGIERAAALIGNAQGVLHQLHEALIAPVADQLAGFQRLVVVPHGALHYLPFQALYDGQQYLIEQFDLSRLPAASLLRYCCQRPEKADGTLALGNSFGGQLPHAVQEAQRVAELCSGSALLEADATPAALRELAGTQRILHLALHGNFRADNPLFSGLALGDGWLTTLDIFNLRLQASLVTLSACQTGQNVVGGGDELLGLMRAFLGAGAASLVLSQWSVEDRSTGALMELFYQGLMRGVAKGEALRQAQLRFIRGQLDGEMPAETLTHPYFWAPFFLVGDSGPV